MDVRHMAILSAASLPVSEAERRTVSIRICTIHVRKDSTVHQAGKAQPDEDVPLLELEEKDEQASIPRSHKVTVERTSAMTHSFL
jgi:hypothetical protein